MPWKPKGPTVSWDVSCVGKGETMSWVVCETSVSFATVLHNILKISNGNMTLIKLLGGCKIN